MMKNKKLLNFLEIVLVIAGYSFYVTKKKKTKESLIQNPREEITQTEIEKRYPENKVGNAFEEIVLLARQNDSSFLARFKEIYPEFTEKILDLYPDILNSEFTFCAYLKLNFSTKEIAKYTFVTPKAVQSRKSRIRKKLYIPSDEDLYMWINKIHP